MANEEDLRTHGNMLNILNINECPWFKGKVKNRNEEKEMLDIVFLPKSPLHIFMTLQMSFSSHHILINSPGGLFQKSQTELECFSVNGR